MALTLVARPRRTTPRLPRPAGRAPGIVLAALIAGVGVAASRVSSLASPLFVAIVLGVVVGNLLPRADAFAPGLAWAGRRFLRVGVTLLGLQVSLREVAGLGPGVIALVVAVVASGVLLGVVAGRRLGLTAAQSALIGCGFSICGAAAVAAAEDTVDATDEEVAASIGLVVVIGTAMIGVLPVLVAVLGLSRHAAGIWAGASIQEVAQVVAAGGVIGGGALGVAVVVKLARVLLLAPVLVVLNHRRRSADAPGAGRRAPLVPLFVAGFCALVVAHTWLPLSGTLLSSAHTAETWLLAAGMGALGCGVRIGEARRAGLRPVLLALLVTAWVTAVGLAGALLLG